MESLRSPASEHFVTQQQTMASQLRLHAAQLHQVLQVLPKRLLGTHHGQYRLDPAQHHTDLQPTVSDLDQISKK